MVRFYLFFYLCVVSVLHAVAQEVCLVRGKVVDYVNDSALVNVNVTCKKGSKQYQGITDKNGVFQLHLEKGGNTTLKFTHIGYTTITKVLNCEANSRTVNVEMIPGSLNLDEVVVKRTLPLITQRGDTTVYFADAYRVNSDATAYDLISQKLPGVGLKDGKLEAHGEQVKEIRIDGREYFKSDINLALKNLPANIISEIQVYDQLSDYSLLTGFDDGNTKKAINIKTKKGVSKSQFGKGYAGYGLDDIYKMYGMYNLFNEDLRLSVFAQWNNLNEQNFSMIDLLSATGTVSSSAPSQSPYSKGSADNSFHPTASDDISSMLVDVSEYGVTTSKAIGTNYSDEWMKGKMKFSGHYLFNNSDNYTDYLIYDNYFGETASNNLQSQQINNMNRNHRFNTKYEWQITSKDYVFIRPSLSYQKKRENSILKDWTVTAQDTAELLNQNTQTDQYAVNTAFEVMYMHKFGTKGHAITADVRNSYMYTHEDIEMDFANVQTVESALQSTLCKNTQETYTYMLSYIAPMNRYSRLKIDAGWNKTTGNVHRKTEIRKIDEETFSVDSVLSGSTWNHYGGYLANVSYMFHRNGTNFIAGTEYQKYDLWTCNDAYYFERSYGTWLPYAFLRQKIGRAQLHFQYKVSHKYPGLLQLHDAINNSNAIMAIRGNIMLEPAYSNNLLLRIVAPISRYGSVFVFFANIEQTDKYIASMRSLASESYQESGERRNTEICSYTNADGYFSWSSLVAYGFPVRAISSNLNVSSMVKHCKIPGYWDNHKVFTNTWNWNGYFTVGSNVSENVDFVLDFNAKYTSSENASFEDMNVSYWSLSYGGQLNWQFLSSLKLVLECGHTNYFGSGTSQYNALISNAAIAYKFLKQRKGELRFSINDLLNQDNSFYQTTTELYKREVTTNILGRYALLTFTYNLNTLR